MSEDAHDGGAGEQPPDNVVQIYDFHERKAFTPKPAYDPLEVYDGNLPTELTPRDWLVPGIVPAGRLGMLSGPGGIGKSRIALQLAATLAAGETDWLPGSGIECDGEPRSAIYLTYEDEAREISRRIVDLGYDDPNTPFGNRLTVVRRMGELWKPSKEGSGHTSTLGEATGDLVMIQNLVKERKASLLIIDPVGMAFLSNENDRGLVSQFCRSMDAWAQDSGCAVMLVSHPPKSDARYSGSTAWRNSVRWMMALERAVLVKGQRKDGKDTIRWPALVMDKSNYGITHRYPKWWMTTDGGMPPPGKVEVIDKKAAVLVQAEAEEEAKGNPPMSAYDERPF